MYEKTTFKLIPLISNSKKPLGTGYNESNYNPTINTNQVAIAHLPSGTCSLDVDDYAQSCLYFSQTFNVDLKALLESNPYIYSGNPNKYKIIFKLSRPLQTKQITKDKKVIFELRCKSKNGKTSIDTIPPSMHPDTKLQYQWVGDFNQLQELPTWLNDHWQSLLVVKHIKQCDFNTTYDEIWQALNKIDADCPRLDWLNIGMAIHHADTILGENRGYAIFDKWSQNSTEKYNSFDTKKTYDSIEFDDNGIKIGTLFAMAAENGWYKKTDVSGLFPVITPETRKLVNPNVVMAALQPTPPDLNLELLPPLVKAVANELSVSVGSDPLTTVFACLAVACGAIDSRNELEINVTFKVKPILWFMIIGDSGTTKSPASKPVFQVLKKIVMQDKKKMKAEKMMWEGEEARYNKHKKDWLKYIENPLNSPSVNNISDSASNPPVDLRPSPKPLRIIVQDITSQSLVIRCDANPRGVLCYLDEMMSWAKKMCDTNTTEDRSTWTVSFEGESYERDRITTGTTFAENVAVSVYGNIQPQVIQKYIQKLSEDGMMQRFIPCVIRSKYDNIKPKPTANVMQVLKQWDSRVIELFESGKQNEQPYHTYTLTPDAFKVFDELMDWVIELKKELKLSYQDGDMFLNAVSKSRGLVGRLALVFHLIETNNTPSISADTMQRAASLVKDYILPSCRYTYAEIGRANGYYFSIWITNYIIKKSEKVTTLSLSELKRAATQQWQQLQISDNFKKDTIIRDEMALLESYGWVIVVGDKNAKWQTKEELVTQFHSYRNKIIAIRENLLKKFIK